jgi:hypothetical protein
LKEGIVVLRAGMVVVGRCAWSLLEVAPLLRLVLAFSFHSPILDPLPLEKKEVQPRGWTILKNEGEIAAVYKMALINILLEILHFCNGNI